MNVTIEHTNPETGEITVVAQDMPETPEGPLAEETPAAERLLAYVERIERLDEEASALSKLRKDVMQEVKSSGFDAATVTAIVKRRRRKREEVLKSDRLLAHYSEAIDAPTAFSAQSA